MVVMTGLPHMGYFSVCLNYFTISSTFVHDPTSSSIFLFCPFYFWLWKRKYFLLPFLFLILWVRGALFFYLIFLFGLQAQSAIYHLKSFCITASRSLMLEHVLFKIYNYVILKHIACSSRTRQLSNSTDKHTLTNISLGAWILDIWHISM